MVEMIAREIESRALIVPMPPRVAYHGIRMLGWFVQDLTTTPEEIKGCQQLDCFRWKDYRVRDKTKIMSLDVDEFIRRFLLHVLPDQFRRIRHFGFLANACRTAKLARIRAALALPEPTPVAEPTDYRVRYALLIGQRIDLCPCCGGRMVEVGFTARMPRNSSPYRHPRCDTS